jgi:hypothetical protein
MNITRTQSGFPVIDNLPDADFEFLVDWLDSSWDAKLPSFPKSAQTIAELVAIATENGKQVSDRNLDAAAAYAENQKLQETIAAKWLREECPAELKVNGAISGENLKAISVSIKNEFGGDYSRLNDAVARLTQRRELRYSQTIVKRDAKSTTTITGKGHNASQADVVGADALSTWLKTAPATVLDAKGNLGSENLKNMHAVIDAELGGRRTSQNYDLAARLLKGRGLLKLTAISNPEETARALEARDRKEHAQSQNQNRHNKPDANKFKAEAEEKALKALDEAFKKSTKREDKAEIVAIVRRTKEANASPLVAAQEFSAYGAVQELLARPPGQKHHEKSFVVDAVTAIIAEEQEYSRQHPETAIALWGRIARTVTEKVTGKFARGVR